MEAVLWSSIAAFLAVVAQLVLIKLKKELRTKHILIILLLASSLVHLRRTKNVMGEP